MSLLSLFTSPSIGVEFSEGSIRIAIARKRGKALEVRMKAGAPLPKSALSDSVIREPTQVLDALKKLCTARHLTVKSAVLLIPPQTVYTHLLHLPAEGDRDTLLKAEIAKCIPEDIDDVQYVFKVLRQSKDGVDIGVAVVRKDVLQGYIDVCRQAGLRVGAVTTFPCVLAEEMIATVSPYVLLICAPKEQAQTITVFLQQWPVDEAVLPANTTADDLAKDVKSLQSEYKSRGIELEKVVAYPDDARTGIPWIKSAEEQFVPAIMTSARANQLTVSLLRSGSMRLPNRTMLVAGAAVVFCLAAAFFLYQYSASMFRPSKVEIPITTSGAVTAHPTYDEAIAWATEHHVFGESSSPMAPEAPVTRRAFVSALVPLVTSEDLSLLTKPSGFDDVNAYHEFLPFLRYAKREGIVSGTSFHPDDVITVASALKMAYTAFKVQVPAGDPWFAPYRDHAIAHNVLFNPALGMDTPLRQKDAAWMLWKLQTAAKN